MMKGIDSLNLIIGVAGLTIGILGFVLVITDRSMDRRTHRYFIAFFALLTAYVGSNLIGQFGESVIYQTLCLFFESAFSSFLALLLTGFLLVQSGKAHWERSASFRIAAGLEIIYLALLIYTQFSVKIYYFDTEGLYHRGPYYFVLLVPPVCIMAINLAVLLQRRKRFSAQERIAFGVYIVLPLASMVFQMFFFGVYVIVLGTSIAAMFMFIHIQKEQTGRYIKQEKENARLQIEIMLSQIKPHFLYNSLGAIEELCESDPQMAKNAIITFSRYLRGNMTSIGSAGAIPFERELSHTRFYLELEQIRFEDALQVEYDISCTDFYIPTLTLEPLVENAVRHGIRRNEDGRGTVRISTREFADRFEVSVMDDGPGFDPDRLPEDGHPHVGLSNVRERLLEVCEGSLKIESSPAHGTTVLIVLPKKRSGIENE